MKSEEFLKQIGNNISNTRKRKKLTVQELADLIGMDKSNLIAITKGRNNVTVLTLYKIAKALQVNPKEFFK